MWRVEFLGFEKVCASREYSHGYTEALTEVRVQLE